MQQPRSLVVAVTLVAGLSGTPAIAQTFGTAASADSVSTLRSTSPVSVGQLLDGTITELRRLPSWKTLTILTIGGIAGAAVHPMDGRVTQTMSGSAGMGTTLKMGQRLGGGREQFASAIATYAVGRITKNARVSGIGADLIQAQLLAQGMTATIKTIAGRTRPDGTQYSFPSGHSAVTFATATVLQRNLGWKVGVPAYGLAAYVAASRVQVKRHFLSDVTVGAAIGIVAGRTMTVGSGDRKFSVNPTIHPGGGGVSFAWMGQR